MADDTRTERDGKDPPAIRRLRLVHPAPPAEPKPKRPRRPPSPFTAEESARLRVALKRARSLFGTWACAVDAMGLAENSVYRVANGHSPFTADIAVRLARALGVPLESLYRPPTDATRCPHCGAAKAAR